MSLEEMILRDELRREPPTSGEIGRLIVAASRRLTDARSESIHPETRLEQAYHTILNCALIALRAEGLRVANAPGKHRHAIETLEHTLGIPFNEVSYYQQLRDLRHRDIYEGAAHVSLRDAEEAVESAAGLLGLLLPWLEARGIETPRKEKVE